MIASFVLNFLDTKTLETFTSNQSTLILFRIFDLFELSTMTKVTSFL